VTGRGRGALGPAEALDAPPRLPDQRDPDDVRHTLADLVDAATLDHLHVGEDAPILLVHTATAPNAVLHCLPVLPRRMWRASLEAVWGATAALMAMYAGPSRPRERPEPILHGSDLAANLLDRAPNTATSTSSRSRTRPSRRMSARATRSRSPPLTEPPC